MQSKAQSRQGFTLVEVVVAMGLASMAIGGVYQGVILAKTLNQANEQRVVAFGLCNARMEEVKGMGYTEVVAAQYPTERNLPMTHLGGTSQNALLGRRRTLVYDLTNPDRKVIQVRMFWDYRGKRMAEQATGVVYPK